MSFRGLLPAITSLSLAVLLCTACSSPPPVPSYWPTDGWRTSTPEEQGMDSETLAEMLAALREQNHAIDSVLVIRNGYLVLEVNVFPFRSGIRHEMASCTKSIISALVGIAIAEGYIESVEQKVLSFFPERQIAHRDARKEALTLAHLLTMSSGLDCRDSNPFTMSGFREMEASDDWVQHVLDLPMAAAPGTRFDYCNQGSFLLAAIVRQTTGMTPLAFAERHLFGPLGISDVTWPTSPKGINIGSHRIAMLPQDMAKIGYLYLNRGEWDGAQVVPSAWVEASTRRHTGPGFFGDGYGYQWWVESPIFLALHGLPGIRIYEARGWGGQAVFVVPDKNMVAVFASRLRDFAVPHRLLQSMIIPAATSSVPLPPNRKGLALLQSHLAALEKGGEPKPIPSLPQMAQEISGKNFQMTANEIRWQSFSLHFGDKDAELRMAFAIKKECPVGLDDVFRIGESEVGDQIACKGQWSGDSTFVVNFLELGNTQAYDVRFSFKGDEGDKVSVVVEDLFGHQLGPITGKRQS